MVNSLSKAIIKLTTGLTPISVGTKFFPTDSMQNEYVELFNYTQTILFELEKATENILILEVPDEICLETDFYNFTDEIYAYEHPEQIRIKIFYFPLEETPENIMVRFMSYLLFTRSGHKTRLSPTELRSFNNNPLNQEIIDILNTEEYQSILKFFEENVIFCSSTNPYGIYKECLEYAKNNGTVYTKKQLITDDFGVTKEVDVFDRYEANDPEEYRIVFIDHIGLIGTEKGCSLKQSIDKLSSEYCVKLRNDYNFSIDGLESTKDILL